MIKSIFAREILDSRGNPTVEVFMRTKEGIFSASVPSGASTGSYEAPEIRDGEKRYNGKGVRKAVDNVNKKIAPALLGTDPAKADNTLLEMDKNLLGANAILAVSLAAARATAAKEGIPLYKHIALLSERELSLPRPCFNIINGGAHAGGGVEFQEFMIVPEEGSFAENLRRGSETYMALKKKLKEEYGDMSINVGDEGGFVPPIKTIDDTLEALGDVFQGDIFIDVAASEFMDGKSYRLRGNLANEEEMLSLYSEIVNAFSIKGIEDPFGERAFGGWKKIKEELGGRVLVIGDDLLATNPERIKMAYEEKLCNAAIIKINQIGTLKEAIEAVKLAKEFKWKTVVSHRSGETNDDFIADFAVGVGSDYIKSGAPARGERVSKYNRLLMIEDEIIRGDNNF